MLVSIRPVGDWARNLIIYVVLRGHNPYSQRTQPVTQEQKRPRFIARATPLPLPRMLTPAHTRDPSPRGPPLAPRGGSRAPPPSPGPGRLRRASPPPPLHPGGVGAEAAQALISTGLASSCSRIRCTPAVRSVREALRERPGELGARGGDVCVRPVAGERAGERG